MTLETQEYWETIVCLLVMDYIVLVNSQPSLSPHLKLFSVLMCEARVCCISNR